MAIHSNLKKDFKSLGLIFAADEFLNSYDGGNLEKVIIALENDDLNLLDELDVIPIEALEGEPNEILAKRIRELGDAFTNAMEFAANKQLEIISPLIEGYEHLYNAVDGEVDMSDPGDIHLNSGDLSSIVTSLAKVAKERDLNVYGLAEIKPMPRVLITSKGGFTEYYSDSGVDIAYLNLDYMLEYPETKIPYRFSDLVESNDLIVGSEKIKLVIDLPTEGKFIGPIVSIDYFGEGVVSQNIGRGNGRSHSIHDLVGNSFNEGDLVEINYKNGKGHVTQMEHGKELSGVGR